MCLCSFNLLLVIIITSVGLKAKPAIKEFAKLFYQSNASYWKFNTVPQASFPLTQLFIMNNCSLNIDLV